MFSMSQGRKLSDTQREILVLMKAFHAICVENSITYSLHGGSLIGAIREKGFIPWDDDGDVVMTRENYDKFAKCAPSELAKQGIALDAQTRVPRLLMKKDGETTAFLDIFIYDYITDNRFCANAKIYGNWFLRAFIEDTANFRAARLRNKYSAWKYALYGFFQKVGRLLPDGTALALFTWYNTHVLCGARRRFFRSNDGMQSKWDNWFLDVRDMERLTLVPFEDAEFMVHARYHEVLTQQHGDYMTPVRYGEVENRAHELIKKGL